MYNGRAGMQCYNVQLSCRILLIRQIESQIRQEDLQMPCSVLQKCRGISTSVEENRKETFLSLGMIQLVNCRCLVNAKVSYATSP